MKHDEAIIRYNAVKTLMDMLTQVENGYRDLATDHPDKDESTDNLAEYLTDKVRVQTLEIHFHNLLSNFVMEYYNCLHDRWAAWLDAYEEWYDLCLSSTDKVRRYSNCDHLVLEDVAEFLYAGIIPTEQKTEK